MGKNDWAIVVGIESYFDSASFPPLAGPVNDAKEFFKWVTSPSGGRVPKGQVKLMLPSNFPQPFATIGAAMPTTGAIVSAFDHLKSLAEENVQRIGELRSGDRLYVFFAGHGFAPDLADRLTGLVTADASAEKGKLNHIIGSVMADWFLEASYFKEIFLFVDCCRLILPGTQPFVSPYATLRAADFDENVRFYAYGARVTKDSREWAPDGRNFRGVFTMTLLNGLTGSAYDADNPKDITAESLYTYLHLNFKNFMAPDDRDNPRIPKRPQIDYEILPDVRRVIVSSPRQDFRDRLVGAKAKKFPVRLIVPPAKVGKSVEIQDWKLKRVHQLTLEPTNDLELGRGLFSVMGEGMEVTFSVTGRPERTDVPL